MDDLLDFEWGSGSKHKKPAAQSMSQMSMLERAQAQAAQTAASSAATQAADAQLWDFDALLTSGASSTSAQPMFSKPASGLGHAQAPSQQQNGGAEPDIFAIFDKPVQQPRRQEASAAAPSGSPSRTGHGVQAKPRDVFSFFDDEDSGSTSIRPGQAEEPAREDAPPLPRRSAAKPPQRQAQDAIFSFEDDEQTTRDRDDAILGGDSSPPRRQRPEARQEERRPVSRPRSQEPTLSFEDEEKAARERDAAILGGEPPSSNRRRREGAVTNGTESAAGSAVGAGWANISTSVASMFGTKNEENLLTAFSRTLGGLSDTILGGGRDDGTEESYPAPRPSRRALPSQSASPAPHQRAEQGRVPRSMAGDRSAVAESPRDQPGPSLFRDDDDDDGEAGSSPGGAIRLPDSSSRSSPVPPASPAPAPDPISVPAPRASRRPQQAAPSPAPRRAQPIRVPRSIVSDSSSAIASAASLKEQGNAAFKRGAYGEAEAQYTKALDQLEDGSLRRIPLLNNRAQSRLKNGEAAGASRDCDAVVAIIVPPNKASSSSSATPVYRPQEEAPLPEPLASEINLRDAWAKAVLRRAQASEVLERWVSARRDWDALFRFEKEEGSGKSGVSNMRSAKDGLQRCEEMISGKKKQPAPQASHGGSRSGGAASGSRGTARQSASTAAAIQRAGEAGRARVRAEAAAQAAEEAAKLALKDTVDAAIDAWKEGKEANVRGLLASVETVVVWPEFGWKKIGLHEVITDVQVKKAYTRAIARLHPDKLSKKNYTLEQRMIAAAVFSTLNDAYTAAQS
ncbi:hypothetical protein V8E36_003587 [Tilletia maclaganii]